MMASSLGRELLGDDREDPLVRPGRDWWLVGLCTAVGVVLAAGVGLAAWLMAPAAHVRAGAAGPVGRTGVADDDEAGTDGPACFVTDGNAPGADVYRRAPGASPSRGATPPTTTGTRRTAAPPSTTAPARPARRPASDVCSGVDRAARASACATRSDTVRRSATAASDECAPDDRDRDADNCDTNQRTASQHNHAAAATSHQHASSIHQHIDQPASHRPVSRPCWRWIRTR
jgi:hypothetical protein